MNWFDYLKGRLAYDLFWMGVAVAVCVVVFGIAIAAEASEKRKRGKK